MAETLPAGQIESDFPGLSPREIAKKLAAEDMGWYSVFSGCAADNPSNRFYLRCKTRQQHEELQRNHPYVENLELLCESD